MEKEAKIFEGKTLILPDTNLGQFVLDHLRKNGSHIAQVDAKTGKVLTNKDILDASVKLAEALHLRGVKIGDRIALASENHSFFFTATYAALFCGGVLATLNPEYVESEVRHTLNISKPKIIFVSRYTEKLITSVAETLPWSLEVIELDEEPISVTIPTLQGILEKVKDSLDPLKYNSISISHPEKQEVLILCSSGTTGLPKGVMLSQRNLIAAVSNIGDADVFDFRQNDQIILFLPFFHGYALGVMLAALASDATVIFMKSFEPQLFLDSIEKYKITHLPLIPPVMVFLAKSPILFGRDFSSVREVFCGSAPLSEEVLDEVMKRLGVSWILNCYGLTEFTIGGLVTSRQGSKPGSVGRLYAGASCKIIDLESSELLGPHETGELCMKGDQVMLGYCDNPEATKSTIDQDGWLHTGDLAYYDEDGLLYIVDRLKELIKYQSVQVAPAEIEGILLSHPEVRDAGVTGKPDEVSGEVPIAFIVRQPGSTISASEICQFVKDRLSTHKWLRGGVYFVESIPKNPSGKILRKELKKMHLKI